MAGPEARASMQPSLPHAAARAAIVDGDVAALRRRSGAAVIDAAIEHNPGADPSADRGAENVSITSARTPQGFCQCRGIAVIVDSNRQTISFRYSVGQREIAPARQVRRINHDAGPRIERARSADPDAGDSSPGFRVAGRRADRVDRGSHSSQTGGCICCRHRHSSLVSDFAGGVY